MHLEPDYTILDLACTGRLSIPIAKKVKSVTAIDQSGGMLALLKRTCERRMDNITCLQKRWEDVVIVTSSLMMW